MKTALLALAGLMLLHPKGTPTAAPPCPTDAPPAVTEAASVIQIAILLDTSNSMDGLIDQARSQLWRIVNDFAGARRNGKPVALQVALYEYGNNRLTAQSGFVRQVLPFTGDLDRVSEALFALTTNGGDEYCGTVIQKALEELAWSPSPADMKVVFVAGNEPFTQGPVDFRPVVRRARARGIVVNTIHCGGAAEGIGTGWRDGAVLAAGSYTTIDQDRAVVHVDAPQDAEIARLGVELNRTYIPYGAAGHEGKGRQEAQDRNASVKKGSATARAVTKANRLYSNATWDLVDAVKEGKVDVTKLDPAALPAEMRGVAPGERAAWLAGVAAERQRLQAQINRLNLEREQHVAAARRSSSAADDTFDVALARTLRAQASCKGIDLK